jgi:hypothetical protein
MDSNNRSSTIVITISPRSCGQIPAMESRCIETSLQRVPTCSCSLDRCWDVETGLPLQSLDDWSSAPSSESITALSLAAYSVATLTLTLILPTLPIFDRPGLSLSLGLPLESFETGVILGRSSLIKLLNQNLSEREKRKLVERGGASKRTTDMTTCQTGHLSSTATTTTTTAAASYHTRFSI